MAAGGTGPSLARTGMAIFLALFVFRLLNAHFVQTFWQPDEYFQSLEPAYQLAFGSESGAWITWEWRENLRTSVHPVLFAAVYKITDLICQICSVTDSSRADALLAAPRILQAFCAAFLDHLTWQAAGNVYGPAHSATSATLGLTLISPWQWHCSLRTFSNSLEATLTATALYFFPWRWYLLPEKDDRKPLLLTSLPSIAFENINFAFVRRAYNTAPKGLYPALITAASAFYLRPTNLMIWIAISAALVGCNCNYRKAFTLFQSAVISGLGVLAVFASVDRLYYGKWSFPPLRFVYLNVVQSLATFYGTNRVDYYFTEGIPLLLITALPFAVAGIWVSLQSDRVQEIKEYVERQTRFVFAFTVVSTILLLSTIGHKEVRFIYPLLPMLHILAAKPFAVFFNPLPLPRAWSRQAILVLLVTTNIFIAGYVTTIHQRGVTDVMHYLRHRQEAWFETLTHSDQRRASFSPNISVGFLMPCHSTPWRSHFIYPEIDAWALTCEPPLNLSPVERASYLDEADMFYANPESWLQLNMRDRAELSMTGGVPAKQVEIEAGSDRRKWPNYLVFFEHLEPVLQTILKDIPYRECRRFFNTHWHDDPRRKGDVVVWCLRR